MSFRCFVAILLAAALPTKAATPDEVARFSPDCRCIKPSLEDMAAIRIGCAMPWNSTTPGGNSMRSRLPGSGPGRRKRSRRNTRKRGNVFYFFSGPDFLYAQALWPNAENYVLVAREPVGTMPELDKLPKDQLAPALENLRKTLNAVLSFSFFITQDMKDDLNHQQLNGTLPVILLFASRAGCRIDSIELIGLDNTGAITSEKPVTRGVKIGCFGPHGRPQNIYYFEADLGDWVLKKNDAVLKSARRWGAGRRF
jgi:hypothetical protein